MVGAALLDVDAYEAVEHDVNATSSALLIVLLSAIAAGIGAFSSNGMRGLVVTVVADLISWVLYAAFAYFIGTVIFKTSETRTTLGEILRTLGYAQTPALLLVLGGILLFGGFINIVVFFWILVTTVIALRQALDFSTGRAIGTALVSWLLFVVPFTLIFYAIS